MHHNNSRQRKRPAARSPREHAYQKAKLWLQELLAQGARVKSSDQKQQAAK
jgi:hypothetical protein